MFVAMNNFNVVPGKGEEFERIWRERDSYLKEVPGVIRFALLRGDSEGEYISLSTWESRDAFFAWMQSPAFAAGHRGSSMMGILESPPHPKMFEALLAEEYANASA